MPPPPTTKRKFVCKHAVPSKKIKIENQPTKEWKKYNLKIWNNNGGNWKMITNKRRLSLKKFWDWKNWYPMSITQSVQFKVTLQNIMTLNNKNNLKLIWRPQKIVLTIFLWSPYEFWNYFLLFCEKNVMAILRDIALNL